MIPLPISARALAWLAAVLTACALFSCYDRHRTGAALAKDAAQQAAYVKVRDSLTVAALEAETRAMAAEAEADSLATANRALARTVVDRAPARIVLAPLRDSVVSTAEMVDVCIESVRQCFPAHRRVAEVTAAYDSVLHQVVIAELIPSFERERRAWRTTLAEQQLATGFQRARADAAEWRVAQQALTIRVLTPSPTKRRIEQAKHVALFVAGAYVGVRLARMVPR